LFAVLALLKQKTNPIYETSMLKKYKTASRNLRRRERFFVKKE
jgi:hypothetical protein